MKFHATLPLLLATTATAHKGIAGDEAPPPAETTKTDNFNWTNPFTPLSASNPPPGFTASCTAEWTFMGHEFQLHDLDTPEPLGLKPYADALKGLFREKPYPGGWDGLDPHGYERPLVKMEYTAVPLAVREWIEEEGRKGEDGNNGFAVYKKITFAGTKAAKTVPPPEKGDEEAVKEYRAKDGERIVLFSPGAIYDVLPLWVAESSVCPDFLKDLTKYSPTPQDGGVVAWTVSHNRQPRKAKLRGLVFTIKAQVLEAKDAKKKAEEAAAEKSPAASTEKDEL